MKIKHLLILALVIAFGIISSVGILHYLQLKRQTDFIEAAWNGDLNAVKHYVEAGAFINDGCPQDEGDIGPAAILLAASGGHDDVIVFLLDHGANINRKDSCNNTPLNSAVMNNHISTVKLLLLRGANPNIRGEGSPLWNANGRNYTNIAELLKSHGAIE